MQHFRKITTLSEDMQALGLATGEPSAPKGSDSGQNRALRESSEKNGAKKPAKKLKESMKARREKAKATLQRRLARRESTYKKRVEALVKLSESKNIAPRLQLRLTKALTRRAKVMESLDLSQLANSPVRKADMITAFESVSNVAGILARKFAVVEELMDASGIPVEHPESAYGYDTDETNVRSDNKTGDATDYADGKSGMSGEVEEDDEWADDKKKKDDMAEGEDNADVSMDNGDEDAMPAMAKEDADEDEDKKDDEVKEEDGDADEKKDKDDMAECEADDDMKEEEEDDAEDKKKDAAKMEQYARRAAARLESMPMDFELNTIRMEAENMAASVVNGTVGPIMAGAILNDMVSYLGGALGIYQDLSSDMEKAYIGQEGPDNDDGPAETDKDNPESYIGQEGPKGGTALNQGGIGMSVPGKTDVAGGKSENRTKPAPAKVKVEAKAPAKAAPKVIGKQPSAPAKKK